MKLEEIHRSGVTDNEELGEHSRAAATITFNASFAHEKGNEEVFSQLLTHPEFQAKLESEFAVLLNRTMQAMIRNAQGIKPGYGWTDDYEISVAVEPKQVNSI